MQILVPSSKNNILKKGIVPSMFLFLLVSLLIIFGASFFYFLPYFLLQELAQAAAGDNVSGWTWSENIGWISFNRSDTGNPPTAPFNEGSGPIAQYNSDTGELTGWMRVLAYDGDWDGWIRFCDSTTSNCSGADQIARIDSNGDWHGWAWSDVVIGWLSFNSADPGAGGSAYKVIVPSIVNQPPTASDLNVAQGDYCVTPAHYFSWTYSDPDGDNQSQFQFQVDDNSDFSSPEVDRTYSGLDNPSPTTNNQTVTVAESPGPDQIGYNTTYYWRVKVWDDQGNDSGWVEGSSFTTAKHRYPLIDFNWAPQNPSVQEDVLFADQSTVYGGAGPLKMVIQPALTNRIPSFNLFQRVPNKLPYK
jgi:hypothetical protein